MKYATIAHWAICRKLLEIFISFYIGLIESVWDLIESVSEGFLTYSYLLKEDIISSWCRTLMAYFKR